MLCFDVFVLISLSQFLIYATDKLLTDPQVLKETLVRHGFTFESDTDTEVIPKLAKFVFDNANEEGIFLQLLLLYSSYFSVSFLLHILTFVRHQGAKHVPEFN